jgi:hypothetical protein
MKTALAARLLGVASAVSILSSAAFGDSKRREVLPVGTVIPVKLSSELSSKTSRPGDRFTAVVRFGRDDADMPEGTKVVGVVREALPSGDGKPGVLDLDFTKVIFPGGEAKPIEASLVSLDKKNVKYDSRGRLVAKDDKSKDRLKFVGIGAGAGLLIGALTKQNMLASIFVGAGGGLLANELSKKKPDDVALKPGTEFGVRVDRQFAFYTDRPEVRTASDERNYDRRDRDDRYYKEAVERDKVPGSDLDKFGIGVLIDDRNVDFGSDRPMMKGDTILVPLKAAARTAQVDFDYDATSQVLRARHDAVRVTVGSRIAIVNGERKRMEAAPDVHNGQVYVPMQFLGYATNGSVYYDKGSKTVVVTTHENR